MSGGGAGAGGAPWPPVSTRVPLAPLPYAVHLRMRSELAAAELAAQQAEEAFGDAVVGGVALMKRKKRKYDESMREYDVSLAGVHAARAALVDAMRDLRVLLDAKASKPELERAFARVEALEREVKERTDMSVGEDLNAGAYNRANPVSGPEQRINFLRLGGISHFVRAPPPEYFRTLVNLYDGFVYTKNQPGGDHAVFILEFAGKVYLFNQNDTRVRVPIDGFEDAPWTNAPLVERPMRERSSHILCGAAGECSLLSESLALYWNVHGSRGHTAQRLNNMINACRGCVSVMEVRRALGMRRYREVTKATMEAAIETMESAQMASEDVRSRHERELQMYHPASLPWYGSP